MKSAIFNPLAARELGEAVEYYDEARRGFGDEFLHEVERAIAFLDQYPEAAPKGGTSGAPARSRSWKRGSLSVRVSQPATQVLRSKVSAGFSVSWSSGVVGAS